MASTMPEQVTIIECPRDAFQGLPQFIPTETKIDYLLSLMEAGFSHIDFGSFVSPRAVPQMQDTQQVLDALRPYLKETYLIAIIPNLKGLERVIQAGGIRCAGYPLSISSTFQQRNLHQDLEQSWKVVDDLVARAREARIDLVVYLSMAFGNPYGEAWSADRVITFVDKLAQKGIQQISLSDTVGLAKAQEVHDVFVACLKKFPEVHFGVHLHSRPERWEQPVLAAYEAGCRRFDGALYGIGGCPFAEDELVGNIPTERVVHRFNQMGITTGLNESAIQKPLAKAREILERFGKDGRNGIMESWNNGNRPGCERERSRSMNAIRTELEDRWAWIFLNRPEKRNALNAELITELNQTLADFEDGTEPRALIISGEGKAFCSGLDLEELQQMNRKSYDESLQDAQRYAQLLKRIYLHPKPIVAAVNGAAIAGGCGLASVCDVTLAASTATFGYTEAKIGFVPVIVSNFLIRYMGEKNARELLLTARLIEAAEAQRLGLVNEVVDAGQLRARAREMARQLAGNSPHSLKATKLLLAKLSIPDLEEALNYACELNAQSRSAPDCIEGVAAFLEKRPPRWK